MTQKRPFVLLFGGIGNRLFQLARAHDLRLKGLKPVVADIEEFGDLRAATSKLLGWTQHPMWIDSVALSAALGLERASKTPALRLRIYAEILRFFKAGRRARFNLPLDTDHRSVQIGYFQAKGCITKDSLFAVAQAVHTLVAPSGTADDAPNDAQVLHIRGGDFDAAHRLAPETVKEFLAAFETPCICVTNDPAYVRTHYPEVAVPPSNGPKDDFATLCRAKAILPSNSTFCFWACVIAVRTSGAKLWQRPPDDYWHHLDGHWMRGDA